MKIDAQALWRAVKNVSLFSREKGWAQATKFSSNPATARLELTTSDDFVGIRSQVDWSGIEVPDSFYLSHKDLKELEKFLREKSGEVELHLFADEQTMELRMEEVAVYYVDLKECPDQEWWEMFEEVMLYTNPDQRDTAMEFGFALDPARLSKMNLLEPKGEYPLALNFREVHGNRFVAFKYGPNTAGMISPLRREALEEAYGDKIGEVLW